jgi:nucleotide-binding universal stress UspA family protein
MFCKILVPLDGSHLAERALPPALALAAATGAADQSPGEVLLLRVPVAERMLVQYPARHTFLMPEQSFEHSRRECAHYLDTIQHAYQRPGVSLRPAPTDHLSFVDTDVAGTVIDTAVQEKVDLIVMSPHGRSGFTRWMLGSVTERVLSHAPGPVWIVRSDRPVQRLLLPLDGSELAEAALAPAMALAHQFGCATLLLRVESPVVSDAQSLERREHMEVGADDHLEQRFQEAAAGYLACVAEQFCAAGLKAESMVARGKPANTILEMAEIHHSDLIVMATHGRSGLKRWVYGSVSEKVLRGALCSLMIVRSQN